MIRINVRYDIIIFRNVAIKHIYPIIHSYLCHIIPHAIETIMHQVLSFPLVMKKNSLSLITSNATTAQLMLLRTTQHACALHYYLVGENAFGCVNVSPIIVPPKIQ